MNEPIKDNLIKILAIDESLRKSRAMITYISDLAERQRFILSEGHNRKNTVTKTYVKDYKKKSDKAMILSKATFVFVCTHYGIPKVSKRDSNNAQLYQSHIGFGL